MVAQTTLVCYLLRDELGVVSSWNALVNHLLLVVRRKQVGVHKLSHLNVVGEDVHGNINTLGNRHELISILIVQVGLALDTEKVLVLSESTSFEGSDRLQNLIEFLIVCDRSELEATVLPVEELAHIEGVGHRLVLGELVQQESILMLADEANVRVGIGPLLHVVQK